MTYTSYAYRTMAMQRGWPALRHMLFDPGDPVLCALRRPAYLQPFEKHFWMVQTGAWSGAYRRMRRDRLLRRWRRHTLILQAVLSTFMGVWEEVRFRPGNSGYFEAKASFNKAAAEASERPQ